VETKEGLNAIARKKRSLSGGGFGKHLVEETMTQKNIFPVNVQLWVEFFDQNGHLLRTVPFRYTVKHARHWGLLKKAFQHNGTRRVSSLTNKHFDRYSRIVSNIALKHLTYNRWVSLKVIGPSLTDDNKQVDLYGARVVHWYLLKNIARRHGRKYFYAFNGLIHDMLRRALVSFVDTYLDKAGYKPQRRPRKYLHKKRKEWRDYKGLAEALVTKREAYIHIDREYQGSLLDIKVLPEVLKHVGSAYVFWAVNTPEQMVEAQLLHANSCVTIREKELEELEL
jgi:hypothetical protein